MAKGTKHGNANKNENKNKGEHKTHATPLNNVVKETVERIPEEVQGTKPILNQKPVKHKSMPQYTKEDDKSTAFAVSIKSFKKNKNGTFSITPNDKGLSAIVVSSSFIKDNQPSPGGYYVITEIGGQKYISAEEFELDYSPLKNI